MMPMPFGNPSTYEGHSGVDFGQPTGAVIKASANGIVIDSGWWNSRAGYATLVGYADCSVLYCHQPEAVWRPGKGAQLSLGSGLGEVGSTGFSTGPHLHMEIMTGSGAGTYDGIWNYFDRNRVVGDGSSASDGSDLFNPGNGDSELNIKLYLYEATNHLIIADHLNKTLRDLGDDPNNWERGVFDKMPFTVVREPQWTNTFSGFRYIQ